MEMTDKEIIVMTIQSSSLCARLFLVCLFFAWGAKAQEIKTNPSAPTTKAVNITEIATTDGNLTPTGTSFGGGVTGPSVGLRLADSLSLLGNLTIGVGGGNFALPVTSGSSSGVLMLGSDFFLHGYGANGNTSQNIFIGQNAGNFSTTGIQNTAVGATALIWNGAGAHNTAIGHSALYNNTTGSENTALGDLALTFNTSGNLNIAIGYLAGTNSAGDSNIYIGHAGTTADGGTIRIGTGGIQTKAFIAGISGVTIGSPGAAVMVDANGQLGTVSSSRRFKYDIEDMDQATKNLLRLRPVTFRYKQAQNDGSHPVQYGLIAEEVADVYPELVQYDPKTGEPNTVLYHVLPAMLLNEFQKEHKQEVAQQEQIQSLQDQLRLLQTEMAAFEAREQQGSTLAAIAGGK